MTLIPSFSILANKRPYKVQLLIMHLEEIKDIPFVVRLYQFVFFALVQITLVYCVLWIVLASFLPAPLAD